MKTGITQIIHAGTTPEFLKVAADAGYDTVELAMRSAGDLTVNTTEAELRGFVELAKQLGVEIVSLAHLHCTGNLLDFGSKRDESLQQTRIGLKAAATMGLRTTLHTLGRPSQTLYYDDAYRNGVQSLKELAEDCDRLNVDIAIEFVWSGFLFSPLEMKHFIEEVGSPRIGFYFDPGNMAVFQPPQHWVRILGKHTKMVHLKDWQGNALNGGWTALLQGAVNFPVVMKELRATGYDGPLISEVDASLAPFADTEKAIRQIIKL